jgi:2,5-diketo-D-gluconate reductase B
MTDLPFGLGTAHNQDVERCAACVETALGLGYRHIDTAQGYENEAAVGEGIARSDVPREELFVATKVHEKKLAHDEVLRTTEESLDRLGLDAVDLLYVHTPRLQGNYEAEETLPAFDELRDRGAVRHVGVGNFSPALLDEARDVLDAPLFAHQAEMHPLLHQDELLEYAQEHDHHFVAHTPIVRGEVAGIPELSRVAERHDATAAQVSLAWLLGRENVTPIPGAETERHSRENIGALELDLDATDRERIEAIDRERRVCDWDDGPWNW